jgi:anti-anti-sigma regulatory factor
MDVTRKSHERGLPVLEVSGPLVGRNWQVFIAELKTLMQEGHQEMAIDLSQATRMGQSEAHLLMEVRDRLARKARTLTLVGLSPAAILAISRAYSSRSARAAR